MPSLYFLCQLDPGLGRLRDRLYNKAYAADRAAGALAREWADAFGLPIGIPIAMGAFDAHYGAVGAGVRVGTFVKIIGTSTCDIAIADARRRIPDIPGICGIVPGPFMQVDADVIGMPMLTAGSPQMPALGAAIAAAVAAGERAGGYDRFDAAQQRMTALGTRTFSPEAAAHAVYDELYALYRELHDSFGGVGAAQGDLPSLMKRLLQVRERAPS